MKSIETVISELISNLASKGFDFDAAPIDWTHYPGFSRMIHERFLIPSTSISPQMRRLLFAIGQAWPDPTILALGSFVGYAASWLWVGAASKRPRDASLVGLDVDPVACAQATQNFSEAFGAVDVVFRVADGTRSQTLPESVGLIYIDIDSPEQGKWGYIDALHAQRAGLRSPALVLGHDAVVPKFAAELKAFNAAISEDADFLTPITLPIDDCGLTISQHITERRSS